MLHANKGAMDELRERCRSIPKGFGIVSSSSKTIRYIHSKDAIKHVKSGDLVKTATDLYKDARNRLWCIHDGVPFQLHE